MINGVKDGKSACTPYLHNSRKSKACQGRLPWQPFISPFTMAVNFCYSDTTSALFFSITQAKRKRDPKSACEDIRYSAKANNKGCRHRETAASQKQRRGAVSLCRQPLLFAFAEYRISSHADFGSRFLFACVMLKKRADVVSE